MDLAFSTIHFWIRPVSWKKVVFVDSPRSGSKQALGWGKTAHTPPRAQCATPRDLVRQVLFTAYEEVEGSGQLAPQPTRSP